jgi:dTDP-4-amino-4,6-dideoxygalactose transaminase
MRRRNFKPFDDKIWLSSPTMHGEELKYMQEAYTTNWMSTVGENIDWVEKQLAGRVGCAHGVALSSGTAALHMAVKLAGVKPGDEVFCSDLTFSATVNPVSYEGGRQIFIDSEPDTMNMSPRALEEAFRLHPHVKVVIVADLYGMPAKLDEIRDICDKHGAIMIEDAAEALGAVYKGKPAGSFGHYNAISFNGNKIITGSAGGMLLTDNEEAAWRVRKWSTQSRERATWYQHEEMGYNYRMSNVIAGVVRGQFGYLDEHIDQKKAIYQRYKQGFADLPVTLMPFPDDSYPNFWLSAMLIHKEAMCKQTRSDSEACYIGERGKSCPTEILETLAASNAEGRPFWKPMHMQPIYRMNPFVVLDGDGRGRTNAYVDGDCLDVGKDAFERGLCLPSDNKMTAEQQDQIIEEVRACFD